MSIRRFAALSLPALILLSAAAPAAATDREPRLGLTIRPAVENGLAASLEVEIRFDLPDGAFKPLFLPERLGPLFHIADRIEEVTAADESGPLEMAMTSGERKTGDATQLGDKIRLWTPARPARGVVTVRYRARVSREMMAGPSWEVRSEPRGVSAAGNTFLLLPDDRTAYRIKLRWDLAAMPAGSRSITSLPSDIETRPITADGLREAYFMAGDLFMTRGDGPFRAASTADTPYDQMELLNWTAEAYGKMLKFFGPPPQPTFTVMFRGSRISRASGTELPGALMATMMPGTPLDEVKLLASHEMVHVFLNGLDPEPWFAEGLAVVYQNRAPFMTGLIGEDAYIADVNATARAYYRNVRFGMPMKEAQASFWTDARARLQPYVRGGMYFCLVDAELKAATGGRRGLDAVMREFLARRDAGGSVTVSDWLELVARDLGPAAQSGYEAMMSGRKIVLPSDAFGPCFRRVEERVPVFELGFDPVSLAASPRVIKGLDPRSPAAAAGLREGDKIVWATSQDTAQEKYGEPMTLKVERGGGAIVEIRFLPHGRMTDGYQWRRFKRPCSSLPPDRR